MWRLSPISCEVRTTDLWDGASDTTITGSGTLDMASLPFATTRSATRRLTEVSDMSVAPNPMAARKDVACTSVANTKSVDGNDVSGALPISRHTKQNQTYLSGSSINSKT